MNSVANLSSATAHPRVHLAALARRAESEARRRQAGSPGRTACYHCGEPCADDGWARDDKLFCCQGCLVVHDLLAASGLEQFYQLARYPGSRVRGDAGREKWAYLDEPAIQHRLLDFTDGRTSRVTFRIPAIHCVACVWLLENLFRLHPGIGSSQVNFPRREVAISFAADQLPLSELVSLLASLGYEPALTLDELERRAPNSANRRLWLQLGIAGFAFGNIMLFSLPAYLGLDSLSGPLFKTLFGGLSLLLALPVMTHSAADYWRSARLALRHRRLTLEVPIALGLLALYGQSAFEITTGRGEGYLDSLSGLVFFLLCGRVFQQKTHERLAFDRDYKSFFPLSVTRKRSRPDQDRTDAPPATAAPDDRDNAAPPLEEHIALSQLQVGDRLVVRHGELIPADAKLLSPAALIDYSFVTGESEPVEKHAGDHLYAGGKQLGAAIEVETLKAVSQSYLTALWNHEAFRKRRADDLNTLTNRYSARFTLIVLSVALGAVLTWLCIGDPARAVKAFVSVLIVACPCALALAAPFTLGTAQRCLGRLGVFLKNALVLERLARVDAIALDKTGTLTAPAATPATFHGAPLGTAEERWIYSLARHSTHPHAMRITEALAAQHRPEPVHAYREIPGCGMEGSVGGHAVWLGSRAWLASRGARIEPECRWTPDFTGENSEWTPEVSTTSTVWIAIDGVLRGAYVLANRLRPDADQLLRKLSVRGEITLLSGDHEKERARFRRLLGPDASLHFNQSPLDKLSFIRRLQDAGKTVMMVGDGLNDAGALQQSDVGVAVVEKIGAFSPASDVILDAAQVHRLADILDFARQATRIVRAGFIISALYNVVGVSIAAAGVLSPLICAVLMPLSSVSVVLFACGATTRAAGRAGLAPGHPEDGLQSQSPNRSRNPEGGRPAVALAGSILGPLSNLAPQPTELPKP